MEFERNAFLRKLTTVGGLKDTEMEALEAFLGRPQKFSAGASIGPEERAEAVSWVLLDGWGASSKRLVSGASQIIDFRIPGDLFHACGGISGDAAREFIFFTDVVICELQTPIDVILRQSPPQPAAALLWALSRDSAIITEHLVNVGRRDAIARTAHLLLELGVRLQRVNLGMETCFRCPVAQTPFADALGMSGIHMNRVLRRLRELGLVRFQNSHVEIYDVEKMSALAEFDRKYLE